MRTEHERKRPHTIAHEEIEQRLAAPTFFPCAKILVYREPEEDAFE